MVEAHILTACMAVFKMESLEDQPTEEMFSKESLTSDDTVKRSTLLKAILSVLQEHVSLPSITEHVDFAEESPKDPHCGLCRRISKRSCPRVCSGNFEFRSHFFWNVKTQQGKVMESALYVVGDIFC